MRCFTADSVVEMLVKARFAGIGDIVAYGFDPRRVRPKEIADVLRRISEAFDDRRRPFMALVILTDDINPPWKEAWARDWAREFVDGHTECLRYLLDESLLRRIGYQMDDFPGVGQLRLIVMAGYGEITCDGTYASLRVNAEGKAILMALRGERVGKS